MSARTSSGIIDGTVPLKEERVCSIIRCKEVRELLVPETYNKINCTLSNLKGDQHYYPPSPPLKYFESHIMAVGRFSKVLPGKFSN